MNTKPEIAYSQQRSQSWTRVDMLLSLYRSGISSLDAAIEAKKLKDDAQSSLHRLKAIRVIYGIAAGLDMNHGSVPEQIARLCEFSQFALQTDSLESMESVRTILSTLSSAFEG
ncbi:MAG: flagellar protein FliS, partial [Planctomycetota bacterium]